MLPQANGPLDVESREIYVYYKFITELPERK